MEAFLGQRKEFNQRVRKVCSNDPTLVYTIYQKQAPMHFFDFFKQKKEVPAGGLPTVHHLFLFISVSDFSHFQL